MTLTHVIDVNAIFFENDPDVVATDGEFYLVSQSDCAIDFCDGPEASTTGGVCLSRPCSQPQFSCISVLRQFVAGLDSVRMHLDDTIMFDSSPAQHIDRI